MACHWVFAPTVVPAVMLVVGLVQSMMAPSVQILIQLCRRRVYTPRSYPTVWAARNLACVVGPGLAGFMAGGSQWFGFVVVVGACAVLALLALRLPDTLEQAGDVTHGVRVRPAGRVLAE